MSIGDGQRHRIHEGWRDSGVHAVCAMIGLGLGIDEGNVLIAPLF